MAEEREGREPAENKMGYLPCNKLLISMSLPIMISMLVQALYNVVDSIFVARINENALTAVSLAFPIQSLMIAVMCGTGVGINARLSKKLGEKAFDEVNETAGNAITLTVLSMLLFMLFGVFGAEAFFKAQTNDAQIVSYGISYLKIVTILCGGFAFQVTFERLVQSTGRTVYSMISQGAGAVTNIILDPIMIFGLFGFPEMGVAGAALATVVGQWIGAALGFYFNWRYNPEIRLHVRNFSLKKKIVKQVYAVGIPSIIMQSIGSVMTFGMNKILLGFSSTAAAVFGVYFKLQSFAFMPVFGLNNGVVPIIAYNYGARKPGRIRETFRLACMYAVAILLLAFLCFQLMPGKLLSMFNNSEGFLAIGVTALRVISLSFIFAGFCISCSSIFQALGHGMFSLWVSLVRQLIVLLPAAFLLANAFGLSAVWWAFPIAELFSLTLSVIFLRRVFKKEIKPMEAELKERDQIETV